MHIILLGPPGSGKGTQGAILAYRLQLPKMATGDLLRGAVKDQTELGLAADEYMRQGLLVPDKVILGLIEEVLSAVGAREGVIMDGFPRTIAQAKAIDQLLTQLGGTIDRVLTLDVPDGELVQRMLDRATKEGRSDDNKEAIQQRLASYREQTEPLIAFYDVRGLVRRVAGTGTIEQIADRIRQALES